MEKKSYTLNDGRQVNIRQLQSQDKESLIQLYSSLNKSIIRLNQKPPLPLHIEQKFLFPDYFISLVTEHNGRIVGYGEIQKDPRKLNGELIIYIHPDYHRVGLGTAMMIIILKDATIQQLQKINLQVGAENRAAIRLFRKFGFQKHLSTKEIHHGKEYDILYMDKTLTK
jgi:ribosomal protein S18 acetylase RimI-like enzyme